jgi:hypothetical protein
MWGSGGATMDIIVKQSNSTTWVMIDLLGRPMGEVVEQPKGEFTIAPCGSAIGTTSGLKLSSFSSLDAALAEVERHTRGRCRMVSVAIAPASEEP